MSNYWKKKLDELNQSNANSSSGSAAPADYWKQRMTELEKEEQKKKEAQKTTAPITRPHGGGGGKVEPKRTWFQKGLFEDGYDFGDVTRTILGTDRDVKENAATGVIGIGEKIVDALLMIGASQAQGEMAKRASEEIAFNAIRGKNTEGIRESWDKTAKDVKDQTSAIVAKDLYDEEKVAKAIVTGPLDKYIDTETDSVLGEKSDALAQSAGQLAVQYGANAIAPGSGMVLVGLTSLGSEAESALQQGATFEEATLSGAISAGAEMLTEKIGGINFGGKTLTDAAFEKLSRHMTSKISKFLITSGKLSVDALSEGGEEIVSGYIGAVGQKLTYMEEKEIKEIFTNEELFESFIGGVVLGGGGGTVSAVKATAQGTDYVSGLTKNEKSVVDKVYQDRVVEAEKNGKVTERQKTKIYDEVIAEMEKGYISTDTIEEVLGDRSSYDSLAKEAEEYDTLYNTASGQLSKAQQDRLAELDAKNKANPYKDALKNARDQHSQSVFELIKDTRLSESYNEKARRSQAYQADLSVYDTKQQAVIQKAIDSGILNNTRRTHEFVDLVAKISADKGVLFDFTDNAKLKDSVFAVDGKFVNGYFDKQNRTVGVNIDSAKALNTVVGHEITHVLEGTEVYDALKQTLFEYAQSKGDYQGRYDSLAELYKDVKDADVEAELAADLVGDYLFTDADFINHLSTKNRNVFQKIYDELMYLYKIATAGSKEARELEKVKKAFEKAYKEGGNATADTKYSLSNSEAMEQSINDLRSEIETINDDLMFAEGDEYRTLSNKLVKLNHELDKLLAQERKATKKTPLKTVLDNLSQYRRSDLESLAEQVSEGAWDGYEDLSRAELEDGIREIIEEMGYSPIEMQNAKHGLWVRPVESAKYSLSDSDGKLLSKEQQEYFKNSVVRDENGNLKVMYHGTPNGNYTVFKAGTYFTDNKEYADRYQNTSASSISTGKTASNPKTFEVYLDIKKPFDLVDAEARRIYIEDYIKGGNAVGINPYLSDAEYDKIKTIDWTEGEDLRDFLIENGYDYDGLVLDEGADGGYGDEVKSRGTSYVVFNPEQVKDINNQNPTADPDIRYSLSTEVDKSYQDAVSRGDMETAQRIVAEVAKNAMPDSKLRTPDGNLRIVYHGTNTGDFTVFNPDYIGMSSGDDGFFGMGFYFAYSKGEASYYGASRVIPAYLDLKNPFDFEKELQTYKGKKASGGYAPDAVALMNFADKFPEIAKNVTIGVVEKGSDTGKQISLLEFSKAFKGVINNKTFEYNEVSNEFGEKETVVTADPETIEYEYGGEKHSYIDYGFQKRFWGTPNELDVAYEYLANSVFEYVDMIPRTRLILDNNREFTAALKKMGYDGAIQSEHGDEAVVFDPAQIKSAEPVTYDDNGNVIPLSDRFNAKSDDIRYSLSEIGEQPKRHGNYNISGKDIALEIAPVAENLTTNATRNASELSTSQEKSQLSEEKSTVAPVTEVTDMFQDTPVQDIEELMAEAKDIIGAMEAYEAVGDTASVEQLMPEYEAVMEKIGQIEEEDRQRVDSLTEGDIPPEMDAPYYSEVQPTHVYDPFAERDESEVGKRSVNAYMYENPEVKPFFQEEALKLLGELNDTTRGERWYNDEVYYESGGEKGFGGVKRHTSASMEELLDSRGMSYADIEKGLNAIIEDHGAENIAAAKKLEFMLNDRLLHGYKDFYSKGRIPPNQDYINLLTEKQITEYSKEAFDTFMANADQYAPPVDDDIAPVFEMQPITETAARVEPHQSVGAAPYGFDPVTQLQYEYGTIPEGEHPVRDDSLPKSTNGKDKVSLTARTAKGAEVTPDGLVDLLDKETVGGRFSYIPIKNSETVQKAYNNIVKKGWEAARGEWEARVRKGEVSAEMTATGALLLNNAAKAGDRTAWLSVLHDYQIMGTNAGQAVQAMRILKTLTPDDSLYMMERSVDQMVEDMKLGTEIVIDEKLKQAYLDAKTDGDRDAARKALAEDVAKQIPSTAMDKWTALRYLNMLGNLRTQVRNIIGNLGMSATSSVKNTVAAGIEALAEKASGGKFQRTKSLFVGKDLLKAARNDFANVESVALNGGKFNDPNAKSIQFQQEVQDARRIFKFAPLEMYRRATNFAMDKGDLVFSKAAYGRILAGYLKANGITETEFSKIDQQILDEARAYAVEQAQEQTFRDNNWLSSWVSKMGRRKDTPKVGKLVSEGVMPFRKTPANILLRAEEYSPLGFVNSTVKSIQAMKGTGNVTGADVVNSWAKTLTGTGLFALGMLLNNSGALSGGPDEDDDKEWFEDQYGWQNYSIHIGDYNFTIDFLSPSAMPLLMGAQFNELRQNGGIELKDLETSLLSIADPMIEMSMLQGVNDTLDNIRYAESNMGQFLVNACVSYLTQGLTNSFLGQIERSAEGQRMSTYVDKDRDLPAWLQKALGKASAKIPGWDYQQIPYVDAWGETEDIAPLPALAENTLSPSYISQGISDDVYEELNRLNDAQSDINVYPQTPDKTVTFDDASGNRYEDYNLSAEEYVELAKLQGKTQKELVKEILSADQYSELTDQEKARAVQLAYQYAREYSRQEVLDADGFGAEWMAKAGDDIVNAIIAHTNDEMTFAYDHPEKYKFLKESGIGYDAYASADEDGKRAYNWAYENPSKYTMSKAVADDFMTFYGYRGDLYDIKADKDKNGKSISGSRKEKVIDYINNLDADYGEKIVLFKSEYPADDTYNYEIIDYLNGRDDISYSEMETILKELGFNVSSDGNITWD